MIELVYNDCFKFLKNINSNSIDLICIDPPYEINYLNLSWDNINLDWCYLINEFYRLLKSTGNLIIFQGWSNIVNLINLFDTSKLSGELKNWII